MPSDARVDDVRPGLLNGLCQFNHFVPAAPIRHQVEHAQSVHDDKFLTHGCSNAPNDFNRQSHSILKASAVFVLSKVGGCHQELVDQIPFRAHDLHTVVSRSLGELCGADKIIYGALDPPFGQGSWLEPIDGRFQGARCYVKWVIAVPTTV